jgi:nucleotide-binding universal stress UspA family protein
MFKKILVCLDGSSLAEQVLPYALEVAERFGGALVLLQVVHLPAAFAAAAAQGGERILEEETVRLASEAKAYLEGVAAPGRTQWTLSPSGLTGGRAWDAWSSAAWPTMSSSIRAPRCLP